MAVSGSWRSWGASRGVVVIMVVIAATIVPRLKPIAQSRRQGGAPTGLVAGLTAHATGKRGLHRIDTCSDVLPR